MMPQTLRRCPEPIDLPEWPRYIDDAELVAKITDRVHALVEHKDSVLTVLLLELERRNPIITRRS